MSANVAYGQVAVIQNSLALGDIDYEEVDNPARDQVNERHPCPAHARD